MAFPLVTASLLGFCGGLAAGFVSGILHTKFKIPALLSRNHYHDWSVFCTNRIMGAPNIALLGEDTVFTWFQNTGT
jgi:putative ABC transport system permease protein